MPEPRFLLLEDVSEMLQVSRAQVYALVRSGELPGIKPEQVGHMPAGSLQEKWFDSPTYGGLRRENSSRK